ncbi:protein CUSTOS [Lissotriton helveticus]
MAAPARGPHVDSDSDSSEDLQRFREATWVVAPVRAPVKDGSTCSRAQPSTRFKADEHEQDGNELQTTPEFRAHVAKKLGAMLDSYIFVSDAAVQASITKQAADEEEDGFRLFCSSVPGCSEDVDPPSLRRRRQSSSSGDQDSDEELQRFREAAVSGTDILKHSAIPIPKQDSHDAVGGECSNENPAKKKKKKKKKKAKVNGTSSTVDEQTFPREQQQQVCSSQNCDTLDAVKLKKKKKKKKKKLLAPI